jgi:excisionase family DNA binding protein
MSKAHVYRMLDGGQLPYVRIPGSKPNVFSRRVDESDLERWIASHKTPERAA